jgi:hypothetical protein
MVAAAVLCPVLAVSPVGAAVPSEVSAERAERWVRRDAVTLRRAAEALVSARLSDPYARIAARVPDYSEWVYGWLSSIAVSARLAGVGAQTVGGQIWRGERIDTDAIVRDLESYVGDAFEEQVIKPEQAEHELFEAWQEAVDQLGKLDRRLAAERAARGAPPRYSQPLLADWYPGALDRLIRGPSATLLEGTTDPAQADLVLGRAVRPLSIRLLSAATRLVIVPVIIPMVGGAAAVSAVDTGGFIGASAFSGAIAIGLWGTDYLLNWVDSAWNRPIFEAQLRAVIDNQRDRTIADAKARMDGAFCRVATVASAC